MNQSPDQTGAVIGKEIDAVPLRHGTAINISACYRATTFPMTIFRHRFGQIRRGAAVVIMRALTQVPAKICAPRGTFGKVIDLLPGVLTDIADLQIACGLIKR